MPPKETKMIKNIIAYTFNKPFSTSQADLELALSDLEFSPCGSQDVSKFGFTSALGNKGGWLAHEYNGRFMVCATKESKILPSQVIKSELDSKVSAIELAEDRKVTKKEKDSLKDEIITTLLPRAFTKQSQTRALILPELNMVLVDSSSSSKAEELLALLRKALGSLPVVCLQFNKPVSEVLTKWVSTSEAGNCFEMLNEAELVGDDKDIAKFKNQDLTEQEVIDHVLQGKSVNKLALKFTDSIEFIMQSDNSIKRIKFSEEFMAANDDIGNDDELSRLDADFILITNGIIELMIALSNSFGGVAENKSI
ncbi:RgdC-like exonuclease [Shewanella sp. phage 3/49]|uniref:exonuclease recombination-associated n=1 Tax=Shewanella sp. phage 3/49 TaxID=1458863 RepID=UPI0004F6CFF2|nr:exonuclease recombination-associated [Shewanella sp. phage 3/49]AHK11795.1 RgdC-like exonuclease [Shewanella sp. phage 3/49]